MTVRLVCRDSRYPLVYTWGNNPKRQTMKGRACRVIARGRMNSCLIELDNGQREIVSRYSVRRP